MKHTKGEWKSVGIAVKDKRDGVFYHTDILCNGTIRVARSSGVGEDLALANARLIAAAPDLLAACKELASIFPEESMSEMDAADFKDRANRIWTAALEAKIATIKAQQADEPER